MATVAIVAGATLYGQARARSERRKARKAADRQRLIEQRRAEFQTGRERKKLLAAQRVRQAELISQGVAGGAPGSSSEQGAIAGGAASARGTIGANQVEQGFVAGIATAQTQQANSLERAGTFQALSQVPGQLAGLA